MAFTPNVQGSRITGSLTGITSVSAVTISATTLYGNGSNLTGLSSGTFTGGTVAGATNFTNGLSANTISATTITTRSLTVTGSTQSLFSGSSSTEMVKIIQDGSGDAFVVQDVANGDPSHFVINASGNTAIGLTAPIGNDKLTVSGNTTIYGTLSATTYAGLPTDVRVTGGTFSSGTATFTNNTGGTFTVTGFSTGGGTFTGGTVSGATYFTGGVSANTLTASGTGQNILTVIGSGNSTTSPIFSVVGSQGELFSVTDSLTGSLFSVNDISGLPILEVFSDNTTLMGSYQAPSLNTTVKVTLTAGTNTVYSIPTSGYTGAFFDYTVISTGSTGARAGTIMSIWSGTTAQYTDVSTNDIGTTAGITFSVSVVGSNAVLSSSATTTGWTLKTIIRSI